MDSKLFESYSASLSGLADEIASKKRPAYAQNEGSDVLANFKRGATAAGIKPLQAWLIHFEKQYSGIATYIRTGAESEPIESRFADVMNYLYLGYALVKENEEPIVYTMNSNEQLEEYAESMNQNQE